MGSGTDSLIYQWGKRLANKGHFVYALCLRSTYPMYNEGIIRLKEDIPFGGTRIGSGVLAPLLGIHKKRELQRELSEFDVVVTQLYPATAAMIGMGKKRPRWVHIEWTTPQLFGALPDLIYLKLATLINGMACRRADKVLVGSRFNKTWVKEKYRVDSKFMYIDGIDFDLFNKDNYTEHPYLKTPTILFVGRLAPHKGLEVLLMAMERLPGVQLKIIGSSISDKYTKSLKEVSKRCGIEDRVEFVGLVPWEKLPWYFATSTVFCSPSFWEGFLRAEAYAMEKPMVGFNRGANVETLMNGGSWVDNISPEPLAEALKPYLEDRQTALAAGQRGYRWAKANLDLDVIVDRLEEELLSI